MRSGIVALSVTIVLILVVSSVAYVPGSDADDTEYGTGMYGTTYDFNTQKINDAIKSVTGRSVEEWVDYFSDKSEYYTYSLESSDALSRFALTRTTQQDENEYTIDDHLTGYLKVHFKADASGLFPQAGIYYANEDESVIELIHRVFVEDRSETSRDVVVHYDIQLFLDLEIVSHADLDTGEITDSCVRFKVALYDIEERNIDFHVETDDYFNPLYAYVGYSETNENNNFFLDIEVDLKMEGMKVFTDSTQQWNVKPVITEHVNKFIISADLANNLWVQLIANSEKDMDDSKLPKLILELIGSGGRMLDLFDTIKSLTSSEVPDITITGLFRAENVTDARGYDYCQMTLQNKDGSSGTVIKIPKSAYTLDLADIVMMIPDYLIDHERRQQIADILTFLGWNDIDVKDISKDLGKQDECSILNSYVNEKINEDDIEYYDIPFTYRIIAYVGLGIAGIIALMIWRRVI